MTSKRLAAVFILVALIGMSPLDPWIDGLLGGGGHKPLNHVVAAILVISMLPPNKFRLNRRAFISIGMLIGVFVSGYFLAPQQNTSWLIYDLTYCLTAWRIASLIGESDWVVLNESVDRIMFWGSVFASAVIGLLILSQLDSFVSLPVLSGDYNSFIFPLSDFGWYKVSLGLFLMIIFSYELTRDDIRWLRWLLLLPALLIVPGIRDLWIALGCASVFVRIRKRGYFVIGAGVVLLALTLVPEFFRRLLEKDIRVINYTNMWEIMRSFPFGVGNGCYHYYVRTAPLYFQTQYSFIPEAPESDIVYIFSSFGVMLGVVYYGALMPCIWGLHRSYNELGASRRFFAFVFFSMIFGGIGQNPMVTYTYWIILGFALAIEVPGRAIRKRSRADELNLVPIVGV